MSLMLICFFAGEISPYRLVSSARARLGQECLVVFRAATLEESWLSGHGFILEVLILPNARKKSAVSERRMRSMRLVVCLARRDWVGICMQLQSNILLLTSF